MGHLNIGFGNIRHTILLVIIALLLASSQLFLAQMASAHATPERSEPVPNSVLAQPPGGVTIWFTESIEPRFSEIQVLDAQGKRVDNRDSFVDRVVPAAISVSLPILPEGTYTVVWRTVSAVDGHAVRGSFIFAVGTTIASTDKAAQVAQPLYQSPADPLLNWLALLSILALVGGLGFELIAWRPVFTRKGASRAIRQTDNKLAARSSRLNWLALVVFLAVSIGQLLNQTLVANEISLSKAIGSPILSILTSTGWGHLWISRVVLLLGTAALIAIFPHSMVKEEDGNENKVLMQARLLFPLVLVCCILFTLSLISHAAATTGIRAAAVLFDYLHLLAAAFWVGGLFHFALAFPIFMHSLSSRERRLTLSRLAPRFSMLAGISVCVLIITGLYSALVQVGDIQSLITPYGLTLLAKVFLTIPLLLLGALNLLRVKPRLRSEEKAGEQMKQLVTAEALLAMLILLSVGFLTSLEPARQATPIHVAPGQVTSEQPPLVFHDVAENMHIILQIEPGRVGLNKVEISLLKLSGNPISNATEVSISFKYLNTDLGENVASTVQIAPGKYVAEEVLFSIAGPWQADLIVRRPDAFDARSSFKFEVAAVSNAGSIAPQSAQALHQHDLYGAGDATDLSNPASIVAGIITFLALGALIVLGLLYLRRM